MILLSYDVETTGLDKQNDRVIEVGMALYSTGQKKILESVGFLVKSDGVPVTDEITKITGITQAAVDKFGYDPIESFDQVGEFMGMADAVIGHNVRRFDKPITDNWAVRCHRSPSDKLWVDTMTDIPGVMGEQLVTMAAKHGFVNLFAHSALTDAQTVLKLISGYDIDKIVERAKSPMVAILSHAPRTATNSDVKKFKFRWNPERKIWWKAVKEMDVEELAKQTPFDISRAGKEISLDQLED